MCAQVGRQWPWFILVLLRLLFICVPLFFIAVLQNFYIQSVIFASERAAAINRGDDEAAADDEEVDLQELWHSRLVQPLRAAGICGPVNSELSMSSSG